VIGLIDLKTNFTIKIILEKEKIGFLFFKEPLRTIGTKGV